MPERTFGWGDLVQGRISVGGLMDRRDLVEGCVCWIIVLVGVLVEEFGGSFGAAGIFGGLVEGLWV